MPDQADPPLDLCLYVAGDSAGARRARENLTRLTKLLPPATKVEVVDVLTSPERAEAAGVIATPTLSNDRSRPPRRIVGDLSDTDQVLNFFGIAARESRT